MASVPERLAAIEAREEDRDRRLAGIQRSLYGEDGVNGLSGDFRALAVSQANHMAATEKAMDRFTIILVGEDGKDGLLQDVAELLRQARVRRKVFWLVAGALVAESTAFAFILLRK